LRQIARLGSWTLAVVLTNQAALYVVLAFAVGIPGTGNVSAYTYGWAFMQMPYAVVVVSVLNALTPQLSGLSTLGDREELGRRLAIGLRQSLVIIVPLAAALVVLAQPVVGVLLHHGRLGTSLPAGTALAVLAAGLPGFTVFQVTIRGLQSMQRAHDTFWLYLLENGVNITLAILMGRHSLGALCATVSIAYTVAAVAGLAVLRARGVRITGTFSHPAVVRAIALAILSALAMALAYNVSSATNGVGLLARLLLAVFAGLVVYGSLVAIGHRRQHARRRATLERGNRGSGQGRHR
jgi:putative peptidoglycan lipid II flippase